MENPALYPNSPRQKVVLEEMWRAIMGQMEDFKPEDEEKYKDACYRAALASWRISRTSR